MGQHALRRLLFYWSGIGWHGDDTTRDLRAAGSRSTLNRSLARLRQTLFRLQFFVGVPLLVSVSDDLVWQPPARDRLCRSSPLGGTLGPGLLERRPVSLGDSVLDAAR